MFRFNTNKIGINTSPNFTFDVSGNINFSGDLYQNGALFTGSQWSDSSNNDLYYNTGNIGIGTSAPSQKLDVSGNIHLTGDIYKNGELITKGPTEWEDFIPTLQGISGGTLDNANSKARYIQIGHVVHVDVVLKYSVPPIINSNNTVRLLLPQQSLNVKDNMIGEATVANSAGNYTYFYAFMDNDSSVYFSTVNKLKFGNDGVKTIPANWTSFSALWISLTYESLTGTSGAGGGGSGGGGSSQWSDASNNAIYYNIGKVGIGSSVPSERLDVYGNILVDGNITPNTSEVYDLGSTTNRWRDIYLSGDSIDLSGTRIRKNPMGGISITDASDNLQDGNFNNLMVAGDFDVSGNINYTGNLYKNGVLFSGSQWTDGSSNSLYYNTGNIGIGSSAPSQKLDVSGNSYFRGNIGIGKTPAAQLDVSGNIYMSDGTAAAPVLAFSSNTNTGLYRPGANIMGLVTGGTERVRVDATGNVGIGSSAPSQRLDVSGNAYFRGNIGIGKTPVTQLDVSGNIYMSNGTAAAPVLAFGSNPNTGLYRPGANIMGLVTGGVERMRVDATGNVGIGSSAPSQQLDVSGNINYTGNMYKNGVLFTGGSSQWTNGTNNAIYYNTGNIGIGSSAPTKTLDIYGTLQVTSNSIVNPFIVTGTEPGAVTCTAAVVLNGTTNDRGYSICTDPSNNLYVAGFYNSNGAVTVPNLDGTNSGKSLSATSNFNSDIFLLKYNTNGICVAAVRMGGANYSDSGNSVCTDLYGNLYVTGNYSNTTSVTVPNLDGSSSGKSLPISSSDDMFLLKYANDASGTCVAAVRLSGTGSDVGYSVCTDPSGNLYVTGSYLSTTTVTVPNLDGTSSGKSLGTTASTSDVFILKYANDVSGTCVAAIKIGGTYANDIGYSVCTDLYGNLYVTGSYYGTATVTVPNLDGSSSGKSLPISSSDDMFLLKYANDASGTCVGAIRLNGTSNDIGLSVCTDVDNNLYVTGTYNCQSNVNVTNLDGSSSGKSLLSTDTVSCLFILKYNSSGTCVAAVQLKGYGNYRGYSVCTDLYSNIYVTGFYYNNNITDVIVPNLDGTNSSKSLAPNTNFDILILKYNANGTCVSAVSLNGTDNDIGYSVCTDSYGNLYVTGKYISGTSVTVPNLDGSSSTKTLPSTVTYLNEDIFLLKYSANNIMSMVGINKTNPESALDVSGNIYMSDGTAAAPVLTFSSDTNTGFYRPGANIMGLVTGGTERVRVDASGNVGIGLTNPQAFLHVINNTYSSTIPIMILQSKDPGSGSYIFDALKMKMGGYSHSISMDLNDMILSAYGDVGTYGSVVMKTNTIERVRIDGNGNVGIGKTNPGTQLDLSTDSARKQSTTTWATGSDARVKVDIEDADTNICYNIIQQLKLKRFAWNPEYYPDVDDRHMLGWIAQDVREVFPKAVKLSAEHGFDDFHTLNSDQLYKVIYGAVSEIIKENTQLKDQVQQLQSDIQMLKTHLGL